MVRAVFRLSLKEACGRTVCEYDARIGCQKTDPQRHGIPEEIQCFNGKVRAAGRLRMRKRGL